MCMNFLTILANKELRRIRQGGAQVLTYAKSDSRLLFSAMYYSEDIYKLTRKYKKLLAFITSDPYGKISADGRVL